MKLSEKYLSGETIYDGKIIRVCKDTVELEDGKRTYREVVHHSGGVTVVALTDDEQVYVVRQFRYPYQTVITELPAGKLEAGENPLEAAKRELREEIGVTADHYEDLGKLYPTVAYDDEIIHMYLATGLHQVGQKLDDGEFLEVERIDLSVLVERIMNNEIRDAKTQAAVLKTDYKRKNERRG
jgi:ADP-ribose pyrophosphatase